MPKNNRFGGNEKELCRDVLGLISQRTNIHPILSKEIEASLGINGATVRDSVRALRRAGYPIIATESGYFMAASIKEVTILVKDFTKRIESMRKTLSAITSKAAERFGQQAVFELGSGISGIYEINRGRAAQNNGTGEEESRSGEVSFLRDYNSEEMEGQDNGSGEDSSSHELLLDGLIAKCM